MQWGDSEISAPFGTKRLIKVTRGITEFRAKRPIIITGDGKPLVALPAEGLNARRLAVFTSLFPPGAVRLVLTAPRALSLGIAASGPVRIGLDAGTDVDTMLALVAGSGIARAATVEPADDKAAAAIEMVKLAQVLPAVLVADWTEAVASTFDPDLVSVEASAVAGFREEVVQSLTISGEAPVPLNSGVRTRFVVFRDALGESPVAVIVGTPDLSRPVQVRLHSACLTGDVFGSRRCDCGDQLEAALKHFAAQEGGVILYLAQEGRGLGLANKMRTYRMQDEGLDTVDANMALGFDDDERDYGVAARMLQMLGITRIILLTNNPAKLDGLAKGGIEIAGRQPLHTPIYADNRRYLTAKAARSGHRLDHLIAALSETSDIETDNAPLAR